MLTIDGSRGEGGGQVLRTSLALSAATGRPFRIEKIRAGRKRPGLMRQHLTCVAAAAEICGARVEGARIGAEALEFVPGELRGGSFHFAVGTAGSAMLVLQTVLPPLLRAEASSSLVVEGGTHNPFAPPFDAIAESWVPQLAKMGARVELELERAGFYPAGGGRVHALVDPVTGARPLELLERGERLAAGGRIVVSNLPLRIAIDERDIVEKKMSWHRGLVLCEEVESAGPGNLVSLHLAYEHVRELAHGFGQRQIAGQQVAREAVRRLRRYLKSTAPVGHHLADQLMVPMALLAGGRYRTLDPSRHTSTNADVIATFLGEDSVRLERLADEDWLIEVAPFGGAG